MNVEKSEFQLVDQRVVKVDFDIEGLEKINLADKSEINLGINVQVKKNETEKSAEVLLNLKIENNNDKNFKMIIAIKGIYIWKNIEDEKKLETYLKVNAPAVLFSYIRSLVTTLSISAGMEPIILPLINFSKNK